MNRLGYFLLYLLSTITVMSCATSDADISCSPVGVWQLQSVDFSSCIQVEEVSTLASFDISCLSIARGKICSESQWVFTEGGDLMIDNFVVFTFDDDRKEVANSLMWTYQEGPTGLIELCQDDRCIALTCTRMENTMILRYQEDSCSGTLTLTWVYE